MLSVELSNLPKDTPIQNVLNGQLEADGIKDKSALELSTAATINLENTQATTMIPKIHNMPPINPL